MEGHLTGRFLDGDGERVRIPVARFDLAAADGEPVERKPDRAAQGRQMKQLLETLDAYIEGCATGFVVLDAALLPAAWQWEFIRDCIGSGAFNTRKQSELSVDSLLNDKTNVITFKRKRLNYKDIALYTESDELDDIRLDLTYWKSAQDWQIGEHLNDSIRKLLKAEDVPLHAWAKAGAEIARVLMKAKAPETRPLWDERHKYPELAELSAPEFLKQVWADQIAPDGSIETQTITKIDSALTNRVSSYIATRVCRGRSDLGKAEGLRLIAHKVGRPKNLQLG